MHKDEKESIDLENISELFVESSREKAATKLLFSQKNYSVLNKSSVSGLSQSLHDNTTLIWNWNLKQNWKAYTF